MANKSYTVSSPIRHNGKDYAEGDSIDLSDKDAKSLLEINVIGTGAATGKTPTMPLDEAERLAAIVDAIGKLSGKDASLWLKNGAPKTEAIAAITGWDVSAKERDAAWTQINDSK